MKKIEIERTKRGHPALWECGGGRRNTGEVTIIASQSGGPKRAIYIRSRGSLANEHHALFIIEKGDYIIECNHHREDFNIYIYKILDFKTETKQKEKTEDIAIAELMHEFSMGEWDKEPPAYLEAAIQAAKEKATCYHCREPHYIDI
jgi:hypothetical protein